MTLFRDRLELLAQFRAGERRALEETYRFYAPVVATFLSRGFTFHSRDRVLRFAGYHEPFDLDNTLAETFVRAFREPARLAYDGLNSYKNYLLAIARNLVIDELRRREVAMSSLVSVVDGAELTADDGREPVGVESPQSAEQRLLSKELAGLCTVFVDRLSERDRRYFAARFEEARTQADAGQAAGLSHMQARTLEKRLRERFYRYLQGNGYLDGRSEGAS